MALALRIPPASTRQILQGGHGVGTEESGRRSRKIAGASRRRVCQVHRHFVQPTRNGTFPPRFGCFSDIVPIVARAQFPVETDVIEKKIYSGSIEHGRGFGFFITVSSCQVTQSNYSGLAVKLMARLQLLGILTALAMGMGVGPAAASSLVPACSTGRSLSLRSVERNSVESHQPSDFEEIHEDTDWSGVRQDAGLSQRNVARTCGVARAAEDEFDDDEAVRQREEFRAKPYAITVPLRIVGLRGSVPPVWLKDFMGSQGKRVKLIAEFRGSLRSIFSELSSSLESKQLTPRSAMAADLVTIGDSWLSKAVSGGLIRPIENAEHFDWYRRMGSKWQNFVRRDEQGLINPHGKVWGVPYRWGSLVIAYNHKKLLLHGIPAIKDWADLWKPELAGKISMVASPREVVGAVLKALGASYNVNDFETDVPGGRRAMEEKFFALQNQVRLFDDVQYLKTLGAGEVWVAVGWSEDIISFAKRTSNITVIAPQSGTSLWADLWAIPATTTIRSNKVGGRIRGPSPLILQWFDFCLQPARGDSFQHNVLVGASPLTLKSYEIDEVRSGDDESGADHEAFWKDGYSNNQVEASPNLETNLEGLLTPDLVAKCEFLEPLSKTALDDFKWLLSRKAVVVNFPVGSFEDLRNRVQWFIGRTLIRVVNCSQELW